MPTNHTATIEALRAEHSINGALAADLLEIHDRTGISLDNWANAQEFIRAVSEDAEIDFDFQPNGA